MYQSSNQGSVDYFSMNQYQGHPLRDIMNYYPPGQATVINETTTITHKKVIVPSYPMRSNYQPAQQQYAPSTSYGTHCMQQQQQPGPSTRNIHPAYRQILPATTSSMQPTASYVQNPGLTVTSESNFQGQNQPVNSQSRLKVRNFDDLNNVNINQITGLDVQGSNQNENLDLICDEDIANALKEFENDPVQNNEIGNLPQTLLRTNEPQSLRQQLVQEQQIRSTRHQQPLQQPPQIQQQQLHQQQNQQQEQQYQQQLQLQQQHQHYQQQLQLQQQQQQQQQRQQQLQQRLKQEQLLRQRLEQQHLSQIQIIQQQQQHQLQQQVPTRSQPQDHGILPAQSISKQQIQQRYRQLLPEKAPKIQKEAQQLQTQQQNPGITARAPDQRQEQNQMPTQRLEQQQSPEISKQLEDQMKTFMPPARDQQRNQQLIEHSLVNNTDNTIGTSVSALKIHAVDPKNGQLIYIYLPNGSTANSTQQTIPVPQTDQTNVNQSQKAITFQNPKSATGTHRMPPTVMGPKPQPQPKQKVIASQPKSAQNLHPHASIAPNNSSNLSQNDQTAREATNNVSNENHSTGASLIPPQSISATKRPSTSSAISVNNSNSADTLDFNNLNVNSIFEEFRRKEGVLKDDNEKQNSTEKLISSTASKENPEEVPPEKTISEVLLKDVLDFSKILPKVQTPEKSQSDEARIVPPIPLESIEEPLYLGSRIRLETSGISKEPKAKKRNMPDLNVPVFRKKPGPKSKTDPEYMKMLEERKRKLQELEKKEKESVSIPEKLNSSRRSSSDTVETVKPPENSIKKVRIAGTIEIAKLSDLFPAKKNKEELNKLVEIAKAPEIHSKPNSSTVDLQNSKNSPQKLVSDEMLKNQKASTSKAVSVDLEKSRSFLKSKVVPEDLLKKTETSSKSGAINLEKEKSGLGSTKVSDEISKKTEIPSTSTPVTYSASKVNPVETPRKIDTPSKLKTSLDSSTPKTTSTEISKKTEIPSTSTPATFPAWKLIPVDTPRKIDTPLRLKYALDTSTPKTTSTEISKEIKPTSASASTGFISEVLEKAPTASTPSDEILKKQEDSSVEKEKSDKIARSQKNSSIPKVIDTKNLRKSEYCPGVKRKSEESDKITDGAPKNKKPMSREKKSSESDPESRINLSKLDRIKEYLGEGSKDFDASSQKRKSTNDESINSLKNESGSRKKSRKASPDSIVKNKNIGREKISLNKNSNEQFLQKRKDSENKKENLKKDQPKLCKPGPKCYKDAFEKNLRKSTSDSESVKKTVEENNNITQDEDVKPNLNDFNFHDELSQSEDLYFSKVIKSMQEKNQFRCVGCGKWMKINSYWINVKDGELKCVGCLKKTVAKGECYDNDHIAQIFNLKAENDELRKKNKQRKKELKELKELKKSLEKPKVKTVIETVPDNRVNKLIKNIKKRDCTCFSSDDNFDIEDES